MNTFSKMITILLFALSVALLVAVGFIPAMVTLALAGVSLKWAVELDYR